MVIEIEIACVFTQPAYLFFADSMKKKMNNYFVLNQQKNCGNKQKLYNYLICPTLSSKTGDILIHKQFLSYPLEPFFIWVTNSLKEISDKKEFMFIRVTKSKNKKIEIFSMGDYTDNPFNLCLTPKISFEPSDLIDNMIVYQ